jgi:hypothetical protein
MQRFDQTIAVDRFGQVLASSCLEAFLSIAVQHLGGQHDHWQSGQARLGL